MWEPLLAIADVAGGDWPRRAREAGRALVRAAEEDDDDLKLKLLSDIRELFLTEFPDGYPEHEGDVPTMARAWRARPSSRSFSALRTGPTALWEKCKSH